MIPKPLMAFNPNTYSDAEVWGLRAGQHDVHDGSKCSDSFNDCCASKTWDEPQNCSGGYVPIASSPDQCPSSWPQCKDTSIGCYGCYPPRGLCKHADLGHGCVPCLSLSLVSVSPAVNLATLVRATRRVKVGVRLWSYHSADRVHRMRRRQLRSHLRRIDGPGLPGKLEQHMVLLCQRGEVSVGGEECCVVRQRHLWSHVAREKKWNKCREGRRVRLMWRACGRGNPLQQLRL